MKAVIEATEALIADFIEHEDYCGCSTGGYETEFLLLELDRIADKTL